MGCNYLGKQLTGWKFSWLEIFRVGIILGGNFPRGNCPVVSYPRWEFSEWEFSRWELSWVGIFLGGKFPGGNCPVGIIRVAIFRVGDFKHNAPNWYRTAECMKKEIHYVLTRLITKVIPAGNLKTILFLLPWSILMRTNYRTPNFRKLSILL